MKRIFKTTWPLFLSIALLMTGNGLQGSLLSMRATMEDFGTTTTGIIMSLYSAGYLAGSIFGPKLVKSVGHIRVFAALAALAAAVILVHGLLVNPVVWGMARIVAGFCFVSLYIVIESWMNDISTNETRGKILGTYLLVIYTAMMIGQYLLNVASPQGPELFMITALLIALALLPISLSDRPAPKFEAPRAIGLKEVYKASPLGVTGIFFSGLGNGIFFSMGPVFALKNGLDVSGVANFMAAFMFGGVAIQIPVGLISDKMERRKIITVVTLATAILSSLCFVFMNAGPLLYFFVFLHGCAALSIYGVCSAYTNDHLDRSQFVGASAALLMINGLGALAGPFTASLFMSAFGKNAFFPLLVVIYAGIFLFALHRARIRPPVPVDEQKPFVSVPQAGTPVAAQIAQDDLMSKD